jgi:hypothetical protein
MRMKSSRHVFGGLLVAVALQGCAGTAQVLSAADRQSLQSLPLFARDGTPRFSLELSCLGEFVSCDTIRHGFEHWADDRHIHMRMVESLDAPPPDRQATTPYRLAVSITPRVVSSYNKICVKGDNLSGGYTPPKVSYRASLYVFDAATGQQLRNLSLHDERVAAYKANANIYVRAEVKAFIAGVDPSYRSQ